MKLDHTFTGTRRIWDFQKTSFPYTVLGVNWNRYSVEAEIVYDREPDDPWSYSLETVRRDKAI